jgi:hypothetical protein
MTFSTLGTFLRRFILRHVRQLDKLSKAILVRSQALGAGPGVEATTIDLYSTMCETHGNSR